MVWVITALVESFSDPARSPAANGSGKTSQIDGSAKITRSNACWPPLRTT